MRLSGLAGISGHSLFRPRFTAGGALRSAYGGLVSPVVVIIFSSLFSVQKEPPGARMRVPALTAMGAERGGRP